jgi:hypothetical protein
MVSWECPEKPRPANTSKEITGVLRWVTTLAIMENNDKMQRYQDL